MTRYILALLAFVSTPALAQTQTFAAIGDTGASSRAKAVADLIKRHNPDNILLLGDLDYSASYTLEESVERAGYGEVKSKLIAAPGNHDYSGCPKGVNCVNAEATQGDLNEFTSYFETGTYHDRRVGDVHYFAINNDKREVDGLNPTGKQAMWLKAELAASNAPHKVVIFHHQYMATKTASQYLKDWPFEEWGATLVAYGHVHQAEVFKHDANNDGEPIFYILSGLGGQSRDFGNKWTPPGRQWRYNGDRGDGAFLFTVTPSEVNVTFRTTNDAVLYSSSLPLPKVSPGPAALDFRNVPRE